MATETLAPDGRLDQTNLIGALSDIDESPSSPDGNWLTASSDNKDSICRVSFPTPTGNLNTGADLQTFTFHIRASNPGGSNIPWSMHLREGGTDLGEINSGTLNGGSSGTNVSGSFDASLLSNIDGSAVEAEIILTGQGGNPNSRNTGEVGAVEWQADYQSPQTVVSPTPGSVSVTGQVVTSNAKDQFTVVNASISLTGQALSALIQQYLTPTPGSIEDAGQTLTINAKTQETPATGSVTYTGQSVIANAKEFINVVSAAITTTGQAISTLVSETIQVANASIIKTGQSLIVNAKEFLSIADAAITVAGQAVSAGANEVIDVVNASITNTGQTVVANAREFISVLKATIQDAGQSITANAKTFENVSPGSVTDTGQPVTAAENTFESPLPASITTTGQAISIAGSTIVSVASAVISLVQQAISLVNLTPDTPPMSGFHYTKIANSVTSDGQGSAVGLVAGDYSIYAWGTFGGGTLKLQISPDGGTTWFDAVDDSGAVISFTSKGVIKSDLQGELVRYDLSGATGPNVNMRLVKDKL